VNIRYSLVAERALADIEKYYTNFSKGACSNVLNDIDSVIDLLSGQPEIGRLHASKKFRLIVTAKYRFVIIYRLDSDYVSILDIYRYQNKNYI
jgi:plasmid stabilization system protein ParE